MGLSRMSEAGRKRCENRKDRQTNKALLKQVAVEDCTAQREAHALFIAEQQRRKKLLEGTNPLTGERYATAKEFNEAVKELEPLNHEESEVAHGTWHRLDYSEMFWDDFALMILGGANDPMPAGYKPLAA